MAQQPAIGRVLIVDDEWSVASFLRDVLASRGYIVTTAPTGEDALDQVEVFEPNVVLLDLTLPGRPGDEVLDALRRTYPSLPVVAMTGDPQRIENALALGAVACLLKPFAIHEVHDVLRAVLGSRK